MLSRNLWHKIVIVGQLFLLPLFLTSMAGCDRDISQPTSESEPELTTLQQAEVAPAPQFRKDLFENVHRQALQFRLDAPQQPRQLVVELRMVEAAISSKPEKDVFSLFEAISDAQASIAILEECKNASKGSSQSWASIKDNVNTIRQIAKSQGIPTENDQWRHIEEIANAYQGGMVVVASNTTDSNVLDMCNQYKLQVTKGEHGHYVPYEASRQAIGVVMEAYLKAAGEHIHNNGAPRGDGR